MYNYFEVEDLFSEAKVIIGYESAKPRFG